jgi:hypothetical protein
MQWQKVETHRMRKGVSAVAEIIQDQNCTEANKTGLRFYHELRLMIFQSRQTAIQGDCD